MGKRLDCASVQRRASRLPRSASAADLILPLPADWVAAAAALLSLSYVTRSHSDVSPRRTLAETFLAAGESLIISEQVGWKPIGRFSLQSMPGAQRVEPSPHAVRGALIRSGRLLATYPSAASEGQSLACFVARRQGHGPARQQRQFRQKLRSGQRFCSVGPLCWKELEQEGLAVNRAALAARRSDHRSWCRPEPWSRFCRALARDPQMAVWGCRVQGRLAAFLLLWEQNRTAHGLALQWDPSLAWAHPTHCLYDGVLHGLFAEGRVEAVVTGRQTIPPRPDLDRFKRHAGFSAEPCSVRVVAHPLLAPWLRGRRQAAVLRRLTRAWPGLADLEVLAWACEQAVLP